MLKRSFQFLFLLCFVWLSVASASPWLEATDPLLRSNLQRLVAAGLLQVPTNTYPLPWRILGDQLSKIDSTMLRPDLELAYNYVNHFYRGAIFNRGNMQLRANVGDETPTLVGFAPLVRERRGVYGSYERTETDYAYRVSANYSSGLDDDLHFNSQDSFLALSYQDLSVSFGLLERWWGPGWATSLAWSQQAKTIPAASARYIFIDSWLGTGLIETNMGKINSDNSYNYLWFSRFTTKPAQWLELGYSYSGRFKSDMDNIGDDFVDLASKEQRNSEYQTTADYRIQLPTVAEVYWHAYGQAASTTDQDELGTLLTGTDWQFAVGESLVQLSAEYLRRHHGYISSARTPANTAVFSWHKGRPLNDSNEETSWTVSTLVQLANDHGIQVLARHTMPKTVSDYETVNLIYTFQINDAQLRLGGEWSNQPGNNDRGKAWFGFAYRI